jgi:hypothetical protein
MSFFFSISTTGALTYKTTLHHVQITHEPACNCKTIQSFMIGSSDATPFHLTDCDQSSRREQHRSTHERDRHTGSMRPKRSAQSGLTSCTLCGLICIGISSALVFKFCSADVTSFCAVGCILLWLATRTPSSRRHKSRRRTCGGSTCQGCRRALNRLGGLLAQLFLKGGPPGRTLLALLANVSIRIADTSKSVREESIRLDSSSSSDSDSDSNSDADCFSASLPGMYHSVPDWRGSATPDDHVRQHTSVSNEHQPRRRNSRAWKRCSACRVVTVGAGFCAMVFLSRQLWPEWTVFHRYTHRHRHEIQVTQQAIEAYMLAHPSVECASSLEVHRTWHHIVVRNSAMLGVSVSGARTSPGATPVALPAEMSGDSLRGPWLMLLNVDIRAADNNMSKWIQTNTSLPSTHSTPHGALPSRQSRANDHGRFTLIDEVPTHCSFLASPVHSMWHSVFAWFAEPGARPAEGYQHADDHDSDGYKTQAMSRQRQIHARVLDTRNWLQLEVTFRDTASLCVQHYHDVFNGMWPCVLR